MECAYKSCTIHVSAGIENGEIVGNARIELPPGLEAGVPETHDMIFAQGFVDEHEAIEFARACAKAWWTNTAKSRRAAKKKPRPGRGTNTRRAKIAALDASYPGHRWAQSGVWSEGMTTGAKPKPVGDISIVKRDRLML